jgi:hypothetical protein
MCIIRPKDDLKNEGLSFFKNSLLKSLIEKYQLEPINSRHSLMPLTTQCLNFAKNLSYSKLERVSKSNTPQFRKITIIRSIVIRVSTQSKMYRIMLLIFSQLNCFLIIFAQR